MDRRIKWVQRHWNIELIAKPYRLLISILVLEAILSLLNLLYIPGVLSLTAWMSAILPVVENIKADATVHPNVAPYIAMTSLLLPIKVFAAYLMMLRQSPRDKELVGYFPSSNATLPRRVISSVLLILLSMGVGWYVFFSYGGEYFHSPDALRSAKDKYHLITGGGIGMWLGWSLMYLLPITFLLGLLVTFFVEWFHRLFKHTGKEG